MTKVEMVQEIIKGLNYPNNNKVIENITYSKKCKIELVYNYYLKSNRTKDDKIFCINLLNIR